MVAELLLFRGDDRESALAAPANEGAAPVQVAVVVRDADDRKKKLADICFVLNIEDTHVATYALKKLVARGYVKSEKTGKEVFFSATPAGRELCGKYRDVRESCLITTLRESGLTNEQIGDAAQLMRNASGLYDTAARAAASL